MPEDQTRRLFNIHNRQVKNAAQITEVPTNKVVVIHQTGCGRKEFRQSAANSTRVTLEPIQTLAIEELADTERRFTR